MDEIIKVQRHLYDDLCGIIDDSRSQIARYVNTGVCVTNWYVGKRINEDVLYNQRAEYGQQIVKRLSIQLTVRYGNGWSAKHLQHCLRVAETFSEDEIVSATQRQFTWTHLKTLVYIKDSLARQFYMEMCHIEHWSTRTLSEKIDSQLYERTAISRRSENIIKEELNKVHETHTLIPDMVFRSTYFLDMLGLPDIFSEKDLETAVLNQIEEFMREMGSDFTLVSRQKRITVDAVDYKMDLVFFHRTLRRMVIVDLKLGKFKPAYEG